MFEELISNLFQSIMLYTCIQNVANFETKLFQFLASGHLQIDDSYQLTKMYM
jgi:hypothetical protein